jgi:hypothetical protein
MSAHSRKEYLVIAIVVCLFARLLRHTLNSDSCIAMLTVLNPRIGQLKNLLGTRNCYTCARQQLLLSRAIATLLPTALLFAQISKFCSSFGHNIRLARRQVN